MSERSTRELAELAKLEGWIAGSLRTQRQLKLGGLIGLALALGVAPFARGYAVIGAITVAGIVGIGMWITAGHIAEWRAKRQLLLAARSRAER